MKQIASSTHYTKIFNSADTCINLKPIMAKFHSSGYALAAKLLRCVSKAETSLRVVCSQVCAETSFFLACGLQVIGMELEFPSAIVFFIELEDYGKKTSLLGKSMVQVLRNAQIYVKTAVIYKCI